MIQPSYFRTISAARHRNRGAVRASQCRPGVRRVAPIPRLCCFLSTRLPRTHPRNPKPADHLIPVTASAPPNSATASRTVLLGPLEPPRRSHSELIFRFWWRKSDIRVCGSEPGGRALLTCAGSRGGVGCLSIVQSVAARAGQVSATGAHSGCLRTAHHGERPHADRRAQHRP